MYVTTGDMYGRKYTYEATAAAFTQPPCGLVARGCFLPLAAPTDPPNPPPTSVCGIFGYCNHGAPRSRREILDCLLTGLRRLEYRGYDSAGICVDAQPSAAACGSNGAAADGSVAADGGTGGSPGGPFCCAATLLL